MKTLTCFPFHCNPFVIIDVQTKILPGVTHWQSPDYFAYFPSNSSVAGFLGEMLSGGINMVGFSWITSPAATELEMIVLDWLANLLKLPSDFLSKGESFNCYFPPSWFWYVYRMRHMCQEEIYQKQTACWLFYWFAKALSRFCRCLLFLFICSLDYQQFGYHITGLGGGAIQGTASEALLVVLLAARDKVLREVGKDGLGRLVVYASDQTHSSLQKACQVCPLPSFTIFNYYLVYNY